MSVASRTEAGRRTTWVGLQDGLRRAFGPSDRTPGRGLRVLAIITALSAYGAIVMGGIVRTTGSGLGCDSPNDNGWPLCRGRLLPPLEQTAVIEFIHRWMAATLSFLLVALVATVLLRYRHNRVLVTAVVAVTVLTIAQIVLGAVTVYAKLPGSIVMVHLANAELLLGAVLFTCLVTFGATRAVISPGARAAVMWMTAAAAAVYVLVLSGAFVVAKGAGYACDAWPLCGNGFQLDASQTAQYNVFHRWVAGAAGLVLLVALVQVLRAFGNRRGVRTVSYLAGAALLAQAAAGAILVESRLPTWTRSVHVALASATWGAVVLVALLVRARFVEQPVAASEVTA